MARKRPRRAVAAKTATKFDKQAALDVSLPLTQAAYDIAAGKELLLPPGFKLVGPIAIDAKKMARLMAGAPLSQQRLMRAMLDEGTIGGLVTRNAQKKVLAISFRGTRTPEEWLKDFDFIATDYTPVKNWGKVHQGFQMVYSAMRASVTSLVKASVADSTDIWVTGHSLGGAMAPLCAPDVATNMTSIVPRLHTFAAPRPGFHTFQKQFDGLVKTCFRVVNRWDIVWHLPPVIAGYAHVGQEVDVDGGFTLDVSVAHDLETSYKTGLQHLSAQKMVVGIAA